MAAQVFTDESRSWVGKSVTYPPYEVTATDIGKYARTVGFTDPIHFDVDRARAHGYADVVAPLGYHMVIRHACPNLVPIAEFGEDGGGEDLTPPSTAHRRMAGQSETRFFAPIVAGRSVELTKRIEHIAEKVGRSGPLGTVTYGLEFRDQEGTLLVSEEYVRILR